VWKTASRPASISVLPRARRRSTTPGYHEVRFHQVSCPVGCHRIRNTIECVCHVWSQQNGEGVKPLNASMVVYLRRSFGRNTTNAVEAFAMPCDRSSAGPSIMNDRQAAIERGHGGRCRSAVGITRNVECSRSVRSDCHHVVRRHVPSIMAGVQPMNERVHPRWSTSKHRPEHTAL
jgi:hypothetical protein